VRVGLSLPVVQQVPESVQAWERDAGAEAIVAVARAADQAGFHHVSACDHVAIPQSHLPSAGAVWFDAPVTLGFAAAVTSRLRLLSHVIVLPYRHPLTIAKAFATLDALSHGRAILGVGSGHLKAEFRTLAVDFEDRAALTDEYIRAIKTAWLQEVASFSGRFVQFRDVAIAPRPHQRPHPPIWVGGNSRAAVHRAANHAEGWVPWMLTREAFATLADYGREVRRQTQRCGPFDLVAPLHIEDNSPADLRADFERWAAAGATAFHIGFAHRSLNHFLDRLADIAATLAL
jgi:probable F420-dependent oxidoreductase